MYLEGEADDLYYLISSDSFKMLKFEPYFALSISDLVISNESVINILEVKITDDILGKGSFGSVRVGVHSETGLSYAVKCIDLIKSKTEKELKISFLVLEIENILKLRHDNIVDFLGHKLSHEKGRPFLYLITELCKEDFHKHFVEDGPTNDRNPGSARDYDSSLQYFLNIVCQFFDGLSFIHMKKFVHKDIKLQNIFISYDYRVKIGDFGLSDQLKGDVMRSKGGTPLYLPPEVHKSRLYSFATDIFASGLVLYEIWQGEIYYEMDLFQDKKGKDIIEDFKNGVRPLFNDDRPAEDIKDLIRECWNGEFRQRPTAQSICDRLWELFQKHVGERKPKLGKIFQFKPGSAGEKQMKTIGPMSELEIARSQFSQLMSQDAQASSAAKLPSSDLRCFSGGASGRASSSKFDN